MSGTTSNDPAGQPFFEPLEPRLLLSGTGLPGDLDTSFDVDGLVTTYIGTSDYGRSVAIQADGGIVVAGESHQGPTGQDFAVTRYNSAGALDGAFSGDGKVTTDMGGASDIAWDIAIQSDGKIVVAGKADNDFALVRYNGDGSLDTNFDIDGKVITDFAGGEDAAYGVAVQTDGKIVVVGSSSGDFALARYNSDGNLDTTFDGDGLVITDFAGLADVARSVAIQADGMIVLGGCSGEDFALARYNTGGSLDATFGAGGKVTTDFAGSADYGYSLAIQPDGKIVVAGESSGDFALARYNSNGSLDTNLGAGGKVTTDFGGTNDRGYGLAVQADGKIVLAGHAGDDFALARYNSDGTLDATFDGDGRVTTDFMGTSDDAFSVAIQADGKIVAAGRVWKWGSYDFALARYLGDPANQPPVASADGPYTADEGQSFQLDASATTDPDEANSELTYEWDLDYDGATFNVDATGMQPTVSFADDFPARSIAVRVTDTDGLDDLAATTLEVLNVAPEAVIDSIVDDAGQVIGTDTGGVLVGLDAALTGSFSDAGAVDTHSATINWGDGNVTDLGAVGPSDVAATHAYAAAATYTITLTVMDDDGDPGEAVFQIDVVDPAGATSEAADDLAALADDPALEPAAAAAVTSALEELQGQDGGNSSSGVLDMMAQDNHNAAFVKIIKAIQDLEAAEQADPSLDLTHLKQQLALTAKSLSVDVVALAETLANSLKDQSRIEDAYQHLEAGQAFLDANQFEQAVRSFLDALRAVNSIT